MQTVPAVMLRHLCFQVREAMKTVQAPKPGHTFLAVQALTSALESLQNARTARMSLELDHIKTSTVREARELLAAPRTYGTLTLTEIKPVPVPAFEHPRYVDGMSWERYMSE